MKTFAGVRVLVVEDEGPIALMIEDMLEEMGCVVVDSVTAVPEAIACVNAGGFQFALLDVNLRGTSIEPVADAMIEAGIPFAFASGYGRAGVPPHLQDRPIIRKPFTNADLEKVLGDQFP